MSLINYLKDTKTELSHVSWPTKKQGIIFTIVVIAVSILVSIYTGIFDLLFTFVLEQIL